MDSAKAMASEATVVGPRGSSSYHVAPQSEIVGPTGMLQTSTPIMIGGSERKKRGRPRKYKPEESTGRVFSPNPLSSSAGKSYVEDKKMGPTRAISSEKKHRNKIGAEKLDGWIDCFTGSGFLPHVITVNTGEDISSKIMEFSLQGPRSVCIISGSGVVSNVTIRHPSSSGGIITYEGLFEIISFSGSFSPVEMPSTKFGRSGMMSISLSGADGRVVGGLIAGLTIAATPVKVIVASFLLSSLNELKPKKQKMDLPPFTIKGSDGQNEKRGYDQMQQGPSCSTSDDPNNNNWAERSRNSTADINISLQG